MVTRATLTALLAAVLFTAPAHAITLQIKSGEAGGSQGAGIACIEPSARFSGDNFSFVGVTFSSSSFCGTFMALLGMSLVLDGVTYPNPCGFACAQTNTLLEFTTVFPGPTPLALALYTGPYVGTFVMNGHTSLGPPGGVDFVGQGIVTLGYLGSGPPTGSSRQFETFTFTVPELSTLALLGLGALAVRLLPLLLLVGRFKRSRAT